MPGNTLQTITTIELSTICQLTCPYCINHLMPRYGRERGIMSDEVFERSLYWLKILAQRGTQSTVNLNGNGESCLDPKLPERIRAVKDAMGYLRVAFSTNGVNLTEDLCKRILGAGIDQMDLSPHSPAHARKAAVIMSRLGAKGLLNTGSILASHNWAGQLEPENSIDMIFSHPCESLKEGRGYIQTHGGLSPCCFDFRGLGQYGTVFDEDLLEREIRPYELCKTCHQNVEEAV